MGSTRQMDRREVLRGSALVAAATAMGWPARLLAQELATLAVASAGSMRTMLEGPLKTAAASSLKLNLHADTGGADAIAQQIISGKLHPDLFIPITASPIQTLMHAGLVQSAEPIGRTELVLTYSPKSRFAAQFADVAAGRGNLWELLQQPGIRVGRSNPAQDPSGRGVIFAMMLAAKKYNQPKLVATLLGDPMNPAQVVQGVQAAMKTGEMDVAAAYRVSVGTADSMPFIALPEDVNLSRLDVHTAHPDVSLTLEGKTYLPEPLVFYAGLVQDGPNPAAGAAFLQWLKGSEAQGLLHDHGFGAVGDATTLKT